MQTKINKDVQLGQSLNPLNDVVKVSSVDNTTALKDVFTKIDKLGKLWKDGSMDFDLIRYLPRMTKISRQSQIYNALPEKAYVSPNYVDKKTLEFNVTLSANTCTTFSNMHFCLPIQIKSKTDKTANVPDTLMTADNFFVHW